MKGGRRKGGEHKVKDEVYEVRKERRENEVKERKEQMKEKDGRTEDSKEGLKMDKG